MIATYTWEEQTKKLLSEAQEEQKRVEGEIKILEEKQIVLTREVNAYQNALTGYLRRIGKIELIDTYWVQSLTSLPSHKERIKAVAAHFGGTVTTKQLTDVLFPNFIHSKSRHNAYVIIQTLLYEMVGDEVFKKNKPGEYQLLDIQPELVKV